MSARAFASAARSAALASQASFRFFTTRAGAPTAMEKSGTSPFTTACAPSTQPLPTRVPRSTLTFAAIQVSGPIRTGPLTMPWSLIGVVMSSMTWSKSQM
ncbi:hypothetical protein HMPREF9336_04267 [Segniliparus rugosus ATCC BAA-974]|uniref:Uncharacterized protein n=1 Tax=Segniliparus rugosus (strain ATCC BAA-974 / DSM 45345 / CCUG 50838 / CIP 108380 / JCM 13579 / CDC 945) TaxID=679197 RepID=U1N8C6_SEGRC|nr:hypothetical protein HMPREF9336_04267 [Segniliparus rugosus ATCC BAA-974]